jgi:hypothetical protein
LKVIGAGFGRTGTASLKKALEDLGFGPVSHGVDIIFRPHQVLAWQGYHRTGTADWDRVYKRFRSAIDFPVPCAWQDLAAHYPDAKIILTVRDAEKWYRSTSETIFPGPRTVTPDWAMVWFPLTRAYVEFVEGLVWDGLFDGRFADKDHAIKVFEQHIEEVKATADPDRLLVYDVAQGWGPLCEFLGVPEPDAPFPHINDTAQMQRWNRMVALTYQAVPPVTAALTALGAFGWIRRRRHKRAR